MRRTGNATSICPLQGVDGESGRLHGAWVVLVASLLVPSVGQPGQKLRYDTEYPAIGYTTTRPNDAVARLQERIDAGTAELEFVPGGGYLASVLRHLEMPLDSQILVFTKTSFQQGLISPETPRAIYFKDDVYVAWVQGGPDLEISSVDSNLGAVFYTLRQDESESPEFRRQTALCLRCHDSFSLTGGGVPRHIMGSGLPDPSGRIAFHEGWTLTSDRTPLEKRWGGWYVTGTHQNQLHLGNLVAKDGNETAPLDLAAGANLTELGELMDTGPYLGQHSDIVALMVIEHQVQVQNQITRLHWDTRSALRGKRPTDLSVAVLEGIEGEAESLLERMLFVGEAPLKGPIEGTSGFAEGFARRGPRDDQGRSLRQLDLTERLFRYRLSYLVYSEAFDALPGLAKGHLYRRLREVLAGEDDSEAFRHLGIEERRAILEILQATKPDFAAAGETRTNVMEPGSASSKH